LGCLRRGTLVRPDTHDSAVVDLSSYCGYFLESITVASALGGTAAVAMSREPCERVVLTLTQVLHVTMDSPGGWNDFIDEVPVRRLPSTGPWPSEAHHLLQHHNNDTDLLWIRLTGPTQIEIAGTLTIQSATSPPT
jgi:hypothetical protein